MATPMSPTTRILALAALVLAAGLFSVRATAVFTAPQASPAIGTAAEQKVAHLLEPIVGAGQVRVSIHQAGEGPNSFLIIFNRGAAAPTEIETLQKTIDQVLINGAGLVPGQDTVTYLSVPFAAAPGMLTRSQLFELIGLGSLALFILAALLAQMTGAPSRAAPRRDDEPAPKADAPQIIPARDVDDAMSQAAHLAAQDPDRTVTVIRKWMKTEPGSAA
ncbi:MAG: hypothetical protein AAGA24_06370 [Pseudomonadota bacterium]